MLLINAVTVASILGPFPSIALRAECLEIAHLIRSAALERLLMINDQLDPGGMTARPARLACVAVSFKDCASYSR